MRDKYHMSPIVKVCFPESFVYILLEVDLMFRKLACVVNVSSDPNLEL